MLKLFIDINILLDIAIERKPYLLKSQQVFTLVETGQAEGFVSALTVATVHYLIKKHASLQIAGRFVKDLMSFVRVVEINQEILEQALRIPEGDFEDHIQIACAELARADYIITRDAKHFKKSKITAISPDQLFLIS